MAQTNIKRSERGQALMMIVLAVVGMVGLTALAVDSGNAYAVRRHAQNTADTAALAAALAKSEEQDWSAAGFARALSNGYDNNGTSNSVTVVSPPTSGPYAGNGAFIQVTIRTTTRTFFASVVGVPQLTSNVTAVSQGRPPVTTPIVFGNAMVGLAPHGCGVFWNNGHGHTLVQGSGVFVNSDDAGCALKQNGSGSVEAPNFNVVGGATYQNGHLIGPILPADPIPYPPAISWPDPMDDCPGPATKSGNVLSPGSVSGHFPPNGVDTLESGVYCIDGDFRVNGGDSLTGNGVTLYMHTGTTVWNGGATINLSAQTTGPYAGLLLYAPLSNDSPITINGNGDSHFTGTFLAPASDINVLGTGAADGFHSQIVGYTVQVGGTADTSILYNDNENYDWTIPPAIELSQ